MGKNIFKWGGGAYIYNYCPPCSRIQICARFSLESSAFRPIASDLKLSRNSKSTSHRQPQKRSENSFTSENILRMISVFDHYHILNKNESLQN